MIGIEYIVNNTIESCKKEVLALQAPQYPRFNILIVNGGFLMRRDAQVRYSPYLRVRYRTRQFGSVRSIPAAKRLVLMIRFVLCVAGFEFALILSNLQVRAMKDMIEVTYPLDEFRDVVVRKTTEDLYNKIDYNFYVSIKIFLNGIENTSIPDVDIFTVETLTFQNGCHKNQS